MGDRAQVGIKDGDHGTVYLYTHWGGTELAETVQAALKREERWDDAEYLARIVFQQMLGDDDGATGFGISTGIHGDIEHPLIVLDTSTRTIAFYERDGERELMAMPFGTYCTLKRADLAKRYRERE